jgi:5-methylcytosine-specific restriction endonuclease McrA
VSYGNMSNDLKALVDANRNTVLELFHHRCILNPAKHKAVVVHEIEPKSKRPSNWWEIENMVPLCAECHDLVHASGAKTFEKRLKELRLG